MLKDDLEVVVCGVRHESGGPVACCSDRVCDPATADPDF